MYKVTLDHIYMTRGDKARFLFTPSYDDETEYTPETGDTFTFTVRKQMQGAVLLTKTIENNKLIILPADTQNMACGRYCYDVQLTKSDGTVETVIPPHIFNLEEEVTF